MITKEELLMTADMMAAAASNINMQTYDTFISSRETLKNQLYELFYEIGIRSDSMPSGMQ